MYGVPYHDYESVHADEEKTQRKRSRKANIEDLPPDPLADYAFFIDFIAAENSSGTTIDSERAFATWITLHPGRFSLLDLPNDPASYFNKTWNEICLDVNREIAKFQSCLEDESEQVDAEQHPHKMMLRQSTLEKVRMRVTNKSNYAANIKNKNNNTPLPRSYSRAVESRSENGISRVFTDERNVTGLQRKTKSCDSESILYTTFEDLISFFLRIRKGNLFLNPLTENEFRHLIKFMNGKRDLDSYIQWRNSLVHHIKNFLPPNPELKYGNSIWEDRPIAGDS